MTNKTSVHQSNISDRPDSFLRISRKLSVREAASYLRLSKSFLDKRRLDGGGPRYLKLGSRVVYDLNDLEAWLVTTQRNHTSNTRRDP